MGEDGLIKYRDNAQSQQLERDIVILPRLTTALRGLQAQHPAFSCTVRLVKRWIASHMLLDYFEEEAIEIIVASLFMNASMYGVPQGFLFDQLALRRRLGGEHVSSSGLPPVFADGISSRLAQSSSPH